MKKILFVLLVIFTMSFVFGQTSQDLLQANKAMGLQMRLNNMAVAFQVLLEKYDATDTSTIAWGHEVLKGNGFGYLSTELKERQKLPDPEPAPADKTSVKDKPIKQP